MLSIDRHVEDGVCKATTAAAVAAAAAAVGVGIRNSRHKVLSLNY